MPRFHCPLAFRSGELLSLPAPAARHVQVLRLQPGEEITLFGALPVDADAQDVNNMGAEFAAVIHSMGRNEVLVRIGEQREVSREPLMSVHLIVGMPAADRMDSLVEKATELGVISLQPLITERSVLRLTAERAQKKRRHWQAIAVAACEQCGRNRVPLVHEIDDFAGWMQTLSRPANAQRWILSPGAPVASLETAMQELRRSNISSLWALSGPEGGLSPKEEQACQEAGFIPVSLGPRVLRADTAPLALLAHLTLGQ